MALFISVEARVPVITEGLCASLYYEVNVLEAASDPRELLENE